MIMFISAAVTVLLAAGLYMLLQSRYHLPSLAAISAVAHLSGHRTSITALLVTPPASVLARYIKLDGYRRENQQAQLKAADIPCTPEFYVAFAVTAGLELLIVGLILLPFAPFLFIPFLLLAVAVFIIEISYAGQKTRKNRLSNETEIPKLAATIAESHQSGLPLLPVLESYSKHCPKRFKKEMNLLIADMKTGNRSAALKRFELRMSNEMATKLVRGLLGIDRGDNMNAYMQTVLLEMRSVELSGLRKESKKRPHELLGANTILFFALIIFCMVFLGMQMFGSLAAVG